MKRTGWLIRAEAPVPYRIAYEAMHDLADRRLADEVPDTLMLLQHPPVYTAGRRSDPTHVLWTEARMESLGAEFHHVDRGGSVTFHGPGQLVGYPVVDLGTRPDVMDHLRRIEEVVIRACRDVGVVVGRDPDRTGVWAGNKKVCAIGVKLSRARVTLHGFALNCTTNLSWFDAIVPCGLIDRGVTSLSVLAGREVTIEETAPLVTRHFEDAFGLQLEAREVLTAAAAV